MIDLVPTMLKILGVEFTFVSRELWEQNIFPAYTIADGAIEIYYSFDFMYRTLYNRIKP